MGPTTSARGGERRAAPLSPMGGSPGTASPVKLLLSRQMVKKYLETSGAPCAAIICHNHITYPAHWCQRPRHLRAVKHRAEIIWDRGHRDCPSPGLQQSWVFCWSQTCPQVLSDLYKSLLSLRVRSLQNTDRKNKSPCEQRD